MADWGSQSITCFRIDPGLAQLFTAQEWRTMPLNRRKLAMILAFAIIGTSAARGQSAIDRLQPLVETSARRLLIAEQVALAKWDSGAAVEDLPREAQVIRAAVRDIDSRGLDPTLVSNFFKAQIEANKVIQYSLLADWRRSGKAPAQAPIDLVATIRPDSTACKRHSSQN
jgi:chorismate mutase